MKLIAVPRLPIEDLLAPGEKPDAGLIDGVRRLSRLFTIDRDKLGLDYLSDPALRLAYLLYFAPVNLAKCLSVLAELPPLPARPLRVLDLGSGPGVGALAMFHYLSSEGRKPPGGTELVLVDRNREILAEAKSLWSNLASMVPGFEVPGLHIALLDLERPGPRAPWKQQTFDLILMVNSLNELFRSARDPIARRAKLLEQLLESLALDGTLVVIEPALRQTTRELHGVRDRLVTQGKATVYSPCLRDRSCPALLHPDDWCHEERPWSPTAMIEAIDRAVGFIKDSLKFSYLVLRKDGRTIADRGQNIYRVVSERMATKGEQRVWLCNETGRQLVGRLEKERSEDNAVFDRWERGAIVRLAEIDRRGTVGRIRPSATADVICPVGESQSESLVRLQR